MGMAPHPRLPPGSLLPPRRTPGEVCDAVCRLLSRQKTIPGAGEGGLRRPEDAGEHAEHTGVRSSLRAGGPRGVIVTEAAGIVSPLILEVSLACRHCHLEFSLGQQIAFRVLGEKKKNQFPRQ